MSNIPDDELFKVIHRVMILSENPLTRPLLQKVLTKNNKQHVLDILMKRHKRWAVVRKLAGVKVKSNRKGKNVYTEDELLQIIRDVASSFPGKKLTTVDYMSVRKFPAINTIARQFGSWNAACKIAGVHTPGLTENKKGRKKSNYLPHAERHKIRVENYKAKGLCLMCGNAWIPPVIIPNTKGPGYCFNCQERFRSYRKVRRELKKRILLISAMLKFYK
ncbi:homing endonuclease associated repeat-containing protein [Paenibacillus chitinolyticus]|uniref:homing endonuclease associated repeat-containing protein n=1 Tax=Paenibacillus chitinolyticus TaxID=79263 RepID=UPI00366DD334